MTRPYSAMAAIAALAACLSATSAQTVVIDFEDLSEGSLGIPWSHHGLTFHDLNTVSGVFPSGETFGPQPDDVAICELATTWYDAFPDWGSRNNLLTFGNAYIPGGNLSLGRLSHVMIDLDSLADSIAVDVGYYENGPWGGIVVHLDVLRNGEVVGSNQFTIADGGGRDNGAIAALSVTGVEFDQVNMYATYGNEYSMPRIILDDFTINWISDGASLSVSPDPLVAGESATFAVVGAAPDTLTYLAYSLSGPGQTFVPLLNVTLDLARPAQAGQARRTDGLGAVSWTLPIPGNGRGRSVWFQAAQFELKTNVVATQIE